MNIINRILGWFGKKKVTLADCDFLPLGDAPISSMSIAPTNTITFCADEYTISNDSICMKFPEGVSCILDFERCDTIAFEVGENKYIYEKVKKE